MENEVLKAIKERRSIRRYKADQITDEELKTVLEAGAHGLPPVMALRNHSSSQYRIRRPAPSFAR